MLIYSLFLRRQIYTSSYDNISRRLCDQDKLKQRVIEILAEWDRLLLNDSDLRDYRWAKTSPELCDLSLDYVSKIKFQGERYHDVSINPVPVASPNTSLNYTALQMSPAAGMSIIYGLERSFGYRHFMTIGIITSLGR